MDVYKTHGAFSWSELMAPDPQAAVAFYGALFGWKSESMDMGGGAYHLVKVGDTAIGGIMGPMPGAPAMPAMWGCYVTVNNVEDTIATCTALGGQVLVPAMDVPGVGRMAVLKDPQGAAFSVMAYSNP